MPNPLEIKRIVKLHETKSVRAVNKLLENPLFSLYEKVVSGGKIRFIVAESKILLRA